MTLVVAAGPAAVAGRTRRPPGWGWSVVVLGGLVAGTAAVGVLSLGGRAAVPEQEAALARVAAGVASGSGWVADPVWTGRPPGALLQLAGWLSGTGALDRHDGDAVAAVREVAVLALVATVLGTWVLARRLGASRGVAAAGVVVLVASPLGLLLHRSVSAESVATPWLVAACCLVVGRRVGPGAAAAAAGCAAVAVLTAPVVLLALPVVGWLLVRHAATDDRRAEATAVATTALLLGGYALVVGFARLRGPEVVADGAGFAPTGPTGELPLLLAWSTDPVTTVLAAVGALLLLVRRPSARPLAAGVAGWLVLCALPGVAAPTAVVVVLPWTALVLPAAVLALGPGRAVRRSARWAPVAAVGAALALAGVPAGAAPAPGTAPGASGPSAAATPAAAVPVLPAAPGRETRQGVGAELADNPGLELTDAVRTALAAGAVDPRPLVVLPRAAADGVLGIAAVQDDDGDGLAESVLVSTVDGSPVGPESALAVLVTSQPPPFTAVVVDTDAGLLLTWPGAPPSGLLGTP